MYLFVNPFMNSAPALTLGLTALANIPRAISNFPVAGNENDVFLLGGVEQNVGAFGTIYKYSISGNSWSTRTTTMAFGESNRGAIMLPSNHVFSFGGGQGGGEVDTIQDYDSGADSISTLSTTLPYPCEGLAYCIAANGSKPLIVGYKNSSGVQNQIGELDPATGVLTGLQTMDTSRGHAVEQIGDEYIIMGGYDTNALNKVRIYNRTTNTLTNMGNMPFANCNFASGIIGSDIYTFGGYNGSTVINKIMKYTRATDTWVDTGLTMPSAIWNINSVSIAAGILLFGGEISGSSSNKTYRFGFS